TSWLLDGRTLTRICFRSLSPQGFLSNRAVPTDPASTLERHQPSSRRVRQNSGEVDHDLPNVVLPVYRLPEARETPGSTPPANLSQSAIILSRYCLTLVVVASAWSIRARAAAER